MGVKLGVLLGICFVLLVFIIAFAVDEAVNVKVKDESVYHGIVSGFAYGTSDFSVSSTDLAINQNCFMSPNIVIVDVNKDKYEVPTASTKYSDMIGEEVYIKVITRERKGKIYDVQAMFL